MEGSGKGLVEGLNEGHIMVRWSGEVQVTLKISSYFRLDKGQVLGMGQGKVI